MKRLREHCLYISVFLVAFVATTFSAWPTRVSAQFSYNGTGDFNDYLQELDKNDLNKNDELSLPAQISELKEQISVDISPEVPAPYDEMTITINAFGTDLNRAEFVWYVNGNKNLSGIGERIFTHKIGDAGSQNDIRVEIAPISGPTIVRNFSFTPGEVDLIWEAQTYTPPFYKGKALFTPEADVITVAMPNLSTNGQRLNPKEAVYKWKFDYRADESKSGFGKNIFAYQGSIIKKPHLFQVESYDPRNTSARGIGRVSLDEQSPQVLMYYTNPLLGTLFNKQISTFYLDATTQEVAISTFPFFQSVKDRRQSGYRWYINNETLNIFNDQPTISLRKQEVGDKTIQLRVTNSLDDKILQTSQNEVTISQ